ncbi:uncharacterized protein METZ01_LOCUS239219, partial [marine metagenome]
MATSLPLPVLVIARGLDPAADDLYGFIPGHGGLRA